MVKAKDYNLVLGQSFLNSLIFNQKYKLDNIFDIITYLYIHQTAIFHSLASQDLAN